jgi:protein SCO1/2
MPSWVSSLPAVNASLNGLAFVLLVVGWVLIRRGHRDAHKKTMLAAFGTSILFLTVYLLYHGAMVHYTGEGQVKFQGTGAIRTVYFVILISHVLLAMAVPVLAIMTIRRGLKQQWESHRRIARITFPIWVYVSLTGVIIYLMLYQWNPQ